MVVCGVFCFSFFFCRLWARERKNSLWFLKRKGPAVLGLDISSTAVKLLELGQSGSRYRVESYAVVPLPPHAVVEKSIADVEAVGSVIERAGKRSGTRLKHAAVAVAGSAVITKVITMPASLSEVDMANQIRLVAVLFFLFLLVVVFLVFLVLGPLVLFL